MCNAWNHPPGCSCGWGGGGYGGGSYSNAFTNYYSKLNANNGFNPAKTLCFKKLDSYTNPNAICPVCGASVFFYKNSSGSAVYFDELGPPWPKHPCIISDSANIKAYSPAVKQSELMPEKKYSWQNNRLNPSVSFVIHKVSSVLYQITINGLNYFFKSYRNNIHKAPPDVLFFSEETNGEIDFYLFWLDRTETHVNGFKIKEKAMLDVSKVAQEPKSSSFTTLPTTRMAQALNALFKKI